MDVDVFPEQTLNGRNLFGGSFSCSNGNVPARGTLTQESRTESPHKNEMVVARGQGVQWKNH